MRNWRIVTSADVTSGSVPAEIRYCDEELANRNVRRRDDEADIRFGDGNGETRVWKHIDFTDCPAGTWSFWIEGGDGGRRGMASAALYEYELHTYFQLQRHKQKSMRDFCIGYCIF